MSRDEVAIRQGEIEQGQRLPETLKITVEDHGRVKGGSGGGRGGHGGGRGKDLSLFRISIWSLRQRL